MSSGKLSNKKLEEMINNTLINTCEGIIAGPKAGFDCGIISSFGKTIAITSDPVTASTAEVGKIAVNVSLNDIACCGVKPLAISVVLMLPESSDETEVNEIMKQVSKVCELHGVAVIGGHTEFSSAVTRPVVVTTAISVAENNEMLNGKSTVQQI